MNNVRIVILSGLIAGSLLSASPASAWDGQWFSPWNEDRWALRAQIHADKDELRRDRSELRHDRQFGAGPAAIAEDHFEVLNDRAELYADRWEYRSHRKAAKFDRKDFKHHRDALRRYF